MIFIYMDSHFICSARTTNLYVESSHFVNTNILRDIHKLSIEVNYE